MIHFQRLVRSIATCVVAAFAFLLLASAPAHAVNMYVDTGLPDLTPDQMAHVANPQPVQLLFQFQTKEKPNGKGTAFVKDKVTEAVKNSGLFSEVSSDPVANGAVLSITLDNIPEAGAAGKGVGVGLTFGLAGTVVTDYYVCTVEYLPPSGGAKITKTVNHSIHSTLGLKSAPPDGVKAKNTQEAVFTMTRQIVSHALNSLGEDPGFTGAAVEAAAPAPSPDAAPVPAAAPTPDAAPATPVATDQTAPAPQAAS